MATGTITLTKSYGMSNNQTELFDMGAYTIPSGGTYSRHKITCDRSYTPDWPVSWGNEYVFNQYYWGNWYNDENKLKHGSYPGHAVIWVQNKTGSFNNITVTLTIEYTYTDSYAVTVSAGTGGTASASTSSASPGATVTITSTPNSGYSANTPTASGISFTSLGNNKWTFTMPSSAVTVSCTFTKINYTVTTASSPAAGGTLTSNKSTAQVGDTVQLTRTASSGYQFSSWTKSPSSLAIGNDLKFTMPASNVSVTANWSKISYNITVNAPGAASGGTASASASTGQIGDTITITCSPSTGYVSDTPTASGITFTGAGANKWTFTMPAAAVTVSCTFTHVLYSITTGVSPSGSGSLSANKSTAHYGESVQLTRSATAGWQFSSWGKNPSSLVIGNDLKFTMPADNVYVSAVFSKINYSVSVGSSPAAGGTVTTNKSTAQVGDTVTLTKTAASGYQFSSWSKTPSNLSINSSNQFTMPAQNVSVTAVWSKINYNVTTSVSSGSGTLSSNKTTAQIGDTVTITASPSAGWSAGTPSASGITFTNAGTNKWSFTMPAAAVAVSISFSKITYTITKAVSPSGAGTVTAAATGQVGDQISVSQTPASGYYFNGWTFNPTGPSVSGGKFSMPANNVTVTANYLKRSTASVNTSSVTGGGTVTLTIVPDKATYSHKYKLSFGTNMETSLTNVAAGTTSVTISVPESWSNYIPSATSKTGGTLLVETYNGSTKIGDYTVTGLTYNVPGSAVPTVGTITTSIIRTIGGTTYADVGNYYVQGKCGVRVQASGSGALSSTISKIEVTISGYSDNGHKTTVNAGSVDWTSGLLTVSGTATISVKVTDSRSRTATSTKNITVTAYNRPSGTLVVYRVDNAGNRDPLGTYAKYELTKAYTAVGSNSLGWTITSQNVTATNPAATGNILPSGRQSFSQTQEYTISMTLADRFETVTIQVTLPTAQFMFFFNATGDRLAFMKATNENLSKNGKDGTIEFSANHQIYIGNQKIEDIFALNSQLTIDFGSNLASISAIETGLNNLISTLSDRAVRGVSFTCASGIESPFTNASYGGTFARHSATRARVILMRSGYDQILTGWLGNNGWTWQNVAVQKEGENFAKSARQSWGTTLSATSFGQGLLIINYSVAYIVWFQGDNNINIRSLRSSDGAKTGSGSITFGEDNVNGTGFTIARSGTSFALTATSNSTMSLIYT